MNIRNMWLLGFLAICNFVFAYQHEFQAYNCSVYIPDGWLLKKTELLPQYGGGQTTLMQAKRADNKRVFRLFSVNVEKSHSLQNLIEGAKLGAENNSGQVIEEKDATINNIPYHIIIIKLPGCYAATYLTIADDVAYTLFYNSTENNFDTDMEWTSLLNSFHYINTPKNQNANIIDPELKSLWDDNKRNWILVIIAIVFGAILISNKDKFLKR